MTGAVDEAGIVARLRAAGCVFAEDEARILVSSAGSAAELEAMIARRVDGFPLEYIVGWTEFCGLRIAVDVGVFVPRQRTAFLVQQALSDANPRAVVIDLCCGSGALGAAMLAVLPNLDLYAADIDPTATDCARRNLDPARVLTGDLFDALPDDLRGRVEVLIANAPYVPTDAIETMPPEARLYEAAVALDGGGDGLQVHRRIAAEADEWLAPGGRLLIETSEAQAPVAAAIFEEAGLRAEVLHSDELYATVVVGTAAS